MNHEIKLPNSQYINTTLGLKYLNGNKKLYLKVLTSFSTRYKDLKIELLDENDFKSTMHTIKGLSATLGMEKLSVLAKTLYELKTEALLVDFSKTLVGIIEDLTRTQTKCILIADDNLNNIDTLVNNLEEHYDILIAIKIDDALESIRDEKIDLILLNSHLSNETILKALKEKNISILYIPKPLNMNIILDEIQHI